MDPRNASMLRRGVVAGALGYVTVVAFYVLINVIAGRSVFYTAERLGEVLLRRPPGTVSLSTDPGPIFVYNGLHLIVFLAIGVAASWLLLETAKHPRWWYLILSVAVIVFFHLVGAVMAFAAPMGEILPLWSVAVSSLLAALVVAGYLLASQPGLAEDLRSAGDFEDPTPS